MSPTAKAIAFLLLYCYCTDTFAQHLEWKDVSSQFEIRKPGIRLFRSQTALNDSPSIAFYAEVDLNRRQTKLAALTIDGLRQTPAQFFNQHEKPAIVVNTTFFSFETNQNLNLVMSEGQMKAYNLPALKSKQSDSFYYPTRGAIGFTYRNKPDVAWVFTDTSERWPYAFQANPVIAKGKTPDPSFRHLRTFDKWKWWKKYTAVGGGPVLVQNGIARVTFREEQMFSDADSSRHPRTAMGYTADNRLIILAVEGRNPGTAIGATLQELANIMVSLGCVEALNLDGGGSSCLLVNGKETIRPSDKEGQRAVPAVLIVR
jgi:hypothetical protein